MTNKCPTHQVRIVPPASTNLRPRRVKALKLKRCTARKLCTDQASPYLSQTHTRNPNPAPSLVKPDTPCHFALRTKFPEPIANPFDSPHSNSLRNPAVQKWRQRNSIRNRSRRLPFGQRMHDEIHWHHKRACDRTLSTDCFCRYCGKSPVCCRECDLCTDHCLAGYAIKRMKAEHPRWHHWPPT